MRIISKTMDIIGNAEYKILKVSDNKNIRYIKFLRFSDRPGRSSATYSTKTEDIGSLYYNKWNGFKQSSVLPIEELEVLDFLKKELPKWAERKEEL